MVSVFILRINSSSVASKQLIMCSFADLSSLSSKNLHQSPVCESVLLYSDPTAGMKGKSLEVGEMPNGEHGICQLHYSSMGTVLREGSSKVLDELGGLP